MEGAWLISYLALWGLTLVLGLVVLAHSRLLGLLHQRLGPGLARPMSDGPELGTRLDRLMGRRLDGTAWTYEFPAATETVLVFVSPQCQTCNELLPHVKDFVRAHREVALVLLSTLDHPAMNQAYVAYRGLERLPYVLAARLASELEIEGTPYAVFLDRQGVVTAKGLVNNYEHLVSLRRPRGAPGPETDTVERERSPQPESVP